MLLGCRRSIIKFLFLLFIELVIVELLNCSTLFRERLPMILLAERVLLRNHLRPITGRFAFQLLPAQVLGCDQLLNARYKFLPDQVQQLLVLLRGEVRVIRYNDVLEDALTRDIVYA